MKRHSLIDLTDASNQQVRSGLYASIARERGDTAEVLLHIAEFDDRRLYLPEGYPSMFAYCVGALHLSEDAAYKRIQAARVARKFPAIFDAIAEGRLHLSAVVLLAAHLTPENAEELLGAAVHKRKSEIELIVAERFPRPPVPELVVPVSPVSTAFSVGELAPGQVGDAPAIESVELAPARAGESPAQGPSEPQPAPVQVGTAPPGGPPSIHPKVTPLAPETFAVQFTMDRRTHDKLRHAQDLLGHQIPNGEIAQVIDRALDALIERLEKQKFAATSRPRSTPSPHKPGTRHIPARVKRAVRQRDGGRCAFVSESGLRCEARSRLEFHHVREFARGGTATVEGIQLRCRAHNQFEAERTFGTEFMREKREQARA